MLNGLNFLVEFLWDSITLPWFTSKDVRGL